MIVWIAAAAVGVLACTLVIFLLVKKKLSRTWGVSLLICALLLAGTGGAGAVGELRSQAEEYGYIYLALCYLEQQNTDPAALYLKRAADRSGYYLTAAQTLLEQMRGNSTVAQLRLGVLEDLQDGSKERSLGMTWLQTWDQTENGLQSVTTALRGQLPLSKRDKAKLDRMFAIESGGWYEEEQSDTEGTLLLQINQALGQQNWHSALNSAVALVRDNTSVSNRLLLAEVIADVTYSGGELNTYQFTDMDQPVGKDSQAREVEELMAQYQEVQEEMTLVQQEILLADGEERDRLADQSAELTEKADALLLQAGNIFALRALNSIADIHSLEAQVVRARLYFAMRSYQESIDALCSAAGSIQSSLSANQSLVNSLRLVKQVYETQGEVGVDTPEFREEMQVLLGSVHPELIQLGLTPLATDMAERIVSDQKTYGSGLYVVGLDSADYPKIRVRLGGQEEVIESIVHKDMVVVNDTRTTIENYEVEYSSQDDQLNSICFVVDTSGSMGGTPIADARDALDQFLTDMSGSAELALVKFESSAETLVDLTSSVGAMRTAVSGLASGGGTDITAGITEGTAVLSGANGARTMIMMTDGQSNVDLNVVQTAADQGITIFTVGFGDVNDDLLQSIADMTGGQYIRADSSTELINVYSSLQGLIGNTVTVTYTVKNTENEVRYFYLMDEERNRSVRREYVVGEEELQQAAPAVTVSSPPVLQTRENLDRMLQYQADATFQATYSGTGLDLATAAQLGDYACTIDSQSEGYLRLLAPAGMPNGIYDLTIQTGDGESFTFPGMLAIGWQMNCRNYRAGSLQIAAGQALRLDGNQLILGGSVQLTEAIPQDGQTVNTLDLRLDGVLIFPGAPLPEMTLAGDGTVQQVSYDQLDLGDTGEAEGQGTLTLNGRDKAYADYIDTVILRDTLRLEYDAAQSHILSGEEVIA